MIVILYSIITSSHYFGLDEPHLPFHNIFYESYFVFDYNNISSHHFGLNQPHLSHLTQLRADLDLFDQTSNNHA